MKPKKRLKKDKKKFHPSGVPLSTMGEISKAIIDLRDREPPLRRNLKTVPEGSTKINLRRTGYVTTTPMGTRIAWDNCARCYAHVLRCHCEDGATPGRSIEYIYDKDTAYSKREEWSIHHDAYKGTFPKRTMKKRTGFVLPSREDRTEAEAVSHESPIALPTKKSLHRKSETRAQQKAQSLSALLRGER